MSTLEARETGMGDSLDAMITQLIEASTTASEFLTGLDAQPTEKPIETPSLAQRRDTRFFPPLPGRLFAILAPLPGKALAVYMLLRLRSRLDKKQTVTLKTAALRPDGISHDQKLRALTCLEAAQLITVDRSHGKNPRVTLRPEHVPWVRGHQ